MRFAPSLHPRCWHSVFKSAGRGATGAIFLALFVFVTPSHARAEFSFERPISHFFNAHLLEQGELQISTASKVTFGLFDSLEVGSTVLGFLGGYPNLYLKHEMFYVPRVFQTSFVSHLMYNNVNLSESDPESGDEAAAEFTPAFLPHSITMLSLFGQWAEGDSTIQSLAGKFGVISTLHLNETNMLNVGFYDFMSAGAESSYNSQMFVHYVCPTVGFDRYLGKHWAMSLVASPAIYALGTTRSYAGDTTIRLDLMDAANRDFGYHMGFATFTYSAAVFNIEFGLAAVKMTSDADFVFPYLNAFWRII